MDDVCYDEKEATKRGIEYTLEQVKQSILGIKIHLEYIERDVIKLEKLKR